MQEIKLKFDEKETTLTTFEYGKRIYEEQVKNIISFDNYDILFIFPDSVSNISSSFVQGLFDSIIEKIGYVGFEDRIIIKSGSDKLTDKILKNIW